MKLHGPSPRQDLYPILAVDCGACCGLCCTALCFSKLEGFPADKASGVPCRHLQPDFRCDIHEILSRRKLKGCLRYECFGAGQRVTRDVYGSRSWREANAQEMFSVFEAVFRLHQMLWYVAEALTLQPAAALGPELSRMADRLLLLSSSAPAAVLGADLDAVQAEVNGLLHETWRRVQNSVGGPQERGKNTDFAGRNWQKTDLRGKDLSMTLLLASNFSGCTLEGVNLLGADLRDAEVRGADLSECLFLTQGQVNSAQGDKRTQLPPFLTPPKAWEKW